MRKRARLVVILKSRGAYLLLSCLTAKSCDYSPWFCPPSISRTALLHKKEKSRRSVSKKGKTITLLAFCCLRDEQRVRNKSLKSSNHLSIVVCTCTRACRCTRIRARARVCTRIHARARVLRRVSRIRGKITRHPRPPACSLTNCYEFWKSDLIITN